MQVWSSVNTIVFLTVMELVSSLPRPDVEWFILSTNPCGIVVSLSDGSSKLTFTIMTFLKIAADFTFNHPV